MQRYFVNQDNLEKNIIVGDDVFHIVRVMRAKIGDKIEVCANNHTYLCEITSLNERAVDFIVLKELESNLSDIKVTLIQGLPKGDKTEDIIMHSTELGINEIILSEMARSVAKIDEKKLNNKLERFNKIAKEASEQAHRSDIPQVLMTKGLKIDYSKYDLKLLLDEEEAKKAKGRTLKDLVFNVESICFVVGPEGGIDPKEREYLLSQGFIPISLGKNILRTQTASLAFLAMLKYIIS